MSRHRDVRSMKYSDEYDGYEDVYGHSMEDDYCVSPSAKQFIYDRNKPAIMRSFFTNLETEEDNKVVEDEDKLKSCRETIGDLLTDIISESELNKTIIEFNYNPEAVIDYILNTKEGLKNETPSGNKSRPQMIPQVMKPTVKIIPATSKSIIKGFDVSATETSNLLTTQSQSPCADKHFQESISKEDLTRKEKKQTTVATLGKLNSSRSQSPIMPEDFEPRAKEKKDALPIYKNKRKGCKEQLNLIMVGHVDVGKSTILGRMLWDLGQVPDKVFHKYQEDSKKMGKQSFVYAWVLDLNEEERERGITMDIGQSKFETESKIITLLDSPGHKDFIPNMITGAAHADVSLLVVDATKGEFETGFESGGQTREHTLLLRALGISQLAVVVNKLDTISWSEERFNEIVEKMSVFLKQVGFKEVITYVPCSGLSGINIVERVEKVEGFSWYNGPTLVEVIDKFKCPERPVEKPFRFSVNDIFKNVGSGFSIFGHMETGMVSVGHKVLILPRNESAIVKGIQIDDNNITHAFAGDHVSLILSGVDHQKLAIGDIICCPENPVPVTSCFQARIVCFNLKKVLMVGMPVVLHQQSLVESAFVSKIVAQLSKSTGEPLKKSCRYLSSNMNAIIQITTQRPICVELQKDSKQLGRITLRIDGLTIAAGLITKIE